MESAGDKRVWLLERNMDDVPDFLCCAWNCKTKRVCRKRINQGVDVMTIIERTEDCEKGVSR